MIKIGIQKSGRLFEDTIQLLKSIGIPISASNTSLKYSFPEFPLEVYFLRDDDIPSYVETGVVDVGIVGKNLVLESQCEVELIRNLGFSKCRLSFASPRGFKLRDLTDFNGKSIATSYPNLVKGFLKENNLNCNIHEISGSVEVAPSIGLAEIVCDLVSSGSTLIKNGLVESFTLLESEAVLIANKSLTETELFSRFLLRIDAVILAKKSKYLVLNAPKERVAEIAGMLPGLKAPTVIPLATPNWVSIHAVVSSENFWELIEKLKKYDAEGILVLPVEKMFS